MPTALVPIANGSEEIEAVTIIDVLRRAGVDVTVAGAGACDVTASRGVRLQAECLIAECVEKTYDLIALPGGMPGAEHLRDSAELTELLKAQQQSGRLYGAICAAPAVVLHAHRLLGTRRATCHPSMRDRLPQFADERVVTDGPCITSQGPGTALEFALALVAALCDAETAHKLRGQMCVTG
jgi:4-methyl-5(b-hydroxyethyl)-thiazole monophosphate biosynthesis